MNHFLQVGHVFTCERFSREAVRRVDNGQPNNERLYVCGDYAEWSTHAPADHDMLGRIPWWVIHTAMTGGGTGHGPGDAYPDGHQVIAEDAEGRRVQFYQSGCFMGVVPPSDITLVEGRDVPPSEAEPLW